MPPKDEPDQYALYCRDRFDRPEASNLRIEKILQGNGNDGITDRLARVETKTGSLEGRLKYYLLVIGGICAPVITKLLYDLVQHIQG